MDIYTPGYFKASRLSDMEKLIEDYPLASLISCDNSNVTQVSKLPLMIRKVDEKLYLEGHMAKGNTHAQYLKKFPQLTIIFDGPHHYISPQYYTKPLEQVPTWNYNAVLIEGRATVMESQDFVVKSIMDFAQKLEKNREWIDAVDKSWIASLSQAIVGLHIEVLEIKGKFKIGQNRESCDRQSLLEHMRVQNASLAQWMEDVLN